LPFFYLRLFQTERALKYFAFLAVFENGLNGFLGRGITVIFLFFFREIHAKMMVFG